MPFTGASQQISRCLPQVRSASGSSASGSSASGSSASGSSASGSSASGSSASGSSASNRTSSLLVTYSLDRWTPSSSSIR